MLTSIKSKTIFFVMFVLILLSLILAFFMYTNVKNDKELMRGGCEFVISTSAEKINKEIIKLENNAIDLALMGEGYYITGRKENIANYVTKRIFQRYPHSLGGGIWFEPYIINAGKRLQCTYAFRKKNGEIVIDKDYQTEKYNYLNQNWYKEIKSKLSDESVLAWSRPYFEKEGGNTLMTTVGAGIYHNNKLIGMSTVDWEISSIINTVSKLPSTKNSFALFADSSNDFVLVSTDKYLQNENLLGVSLSKIPWYSDEMKNQTVFKYHGIKYISYIKTLDNGMILIINVPENELFEEIFKYRNIMSLILLGTSICIAVLMYILLTFNINKPIEKLTRIAHKIGDGDLDTEIKIEKPKEFAELASTFNKMTKDIKDYMTNLEIVTEAKEKMESELSVARTIQYSVLPNYFYPNVNEFEIYATMDTAKEVGGDFYDFFYISPEKFVFLIADVSGKGIPAALFMMTTKALIKNIARECHPPKEFIEIVNSRICENNEQGFFVTLFAAVVDINTGKISYINCGHNPPLIKKKNGAFEYLNLSSNLVLGAVDKMAYKVAESQLEPDDTIFLYTDGVTEALNKNLELYGENRLKQVINSCPDQEVKSIVDYVKQDVNSYMDTGEQSDDLTILAFRYMPGKSFNNNNENSKRKFITEAKKENYPLFLEWLESICKEENIDSSCRMKLELVSEELFLNVSSYAYVDTVGNIEVVFDKANKEIVLEFIDEGMQYNPLEKSEPDITLKTEERQVGGLGIFMVKQSVDDISYEYKDGKNVLTLKFKLNQTI